MDSEIRNLNQKAIEWVASQNFKAHTHGKILLVIGPICLLIGMIDFVVGVTGDEFSWPIIGSIFWMLGVFILMGRSYYLKHKYFELWNNCHQAMEL